MLTGRDLFAPVFGLYFPKILVSIRPEFKKNIKKTSIFS